MTGRIGWYLLCLALGLTTWAAIQPRLQEVAATLNHVAEALTHF